MIRFGIVGAGGIAKKFFRDLQYVEDTTLTAVSARSLESAKKHQAYYKCEYAFESYEAMAKSDVIDAVYIATPHKFHKEHAILFMKHHKHVLLEKPVSVNAKEYEEMIKVAEKERVLLMEAMWTHFLPATQYLLEEIKKETFGKLLDAKIKFGFTIAPFQSKDGRLMNPNLAGGSLLDLGIYPVSFVFLLKQSPITLVDAKATFTKTGVDKGGTIKLKEENGTIYTLKHSMTRVLGDRATLTFEHAKVIMTGFHGCELLIINGKTIKIPLEGEGFVHEIRAFVNNIKEGALENSIMNYQKSLMIMKLMDQIRVKIGLKYPFES